VNLPDHIALNAVFLRPRMGGLETMVKRLVPEMQKLAPGTRFSVFTGPQGVEAMRGEEVELQTHPLLGLRGGKAVAELTLLGWLAPRRGADLLYSVAMTGPLRTASVHVVNVADTTWISHPDPGEMSTVRLWRALVPPVARRADRIIAISEAGKRDIVEHLRVDADRIDVVLLGTAQHLLTAPAPDVRERFGLGDGPVVLSVSAKKAHKNLLRLVRSMRVVAQRHPDAVLVLPGNPTEHEQELRAEAERLALNVRFPGWVSDEELEGLYAVASGAVIASLNEGFGLPVLDAMRRGVPVAASDASSLPEAGGDAARYFDPLDETAIGEAIISLLDDGAALVARGHARAAEFTWERCAEGTLESFERAWAMR
jgi:glycosyltransferase involved in cell wall biosynthesis